MRTPDRVLLWLCLLLPACATFSGRTGDPFPESLVFELPPDAALHLRGSVDGPLGGLGPSLHFDAWIFDGSLRADLRYEEDGRPRHEVLLWTQQSVLLFDRDRGGLTELADGPTLPAWGASFPLEALFWLCLGRWPDTSETPLFAREGRDLEASWSGLLLGGRLVDRSNHLNRTSLSWSEDGQQRRLSALLEAQESLAAGRIPRRVRLDGDSLEMELLLSIESEIVENKGDGVLDPLREP